MTSTPDIQTLCETMRAFSVNDIVTSSADTADTAIPDYEELYRNDPHMTFVGERGEPGRYFVGRHERMYFHVAFVPPSRSSF